MKRVITRNISAKIDNRAYSLCKESMLITTVFKKVEVKLEFLESMMDNVIHHL